MRAHGKKVIIELESNHLIIASLGMEGRFQYEEGNHSNIRFNISNNITISNKNEDDFCLYFDDTRYFGKIDIIESIKEENYFSNIGPCLLKHALTEDTWISSEEWRNLYRPKLLKRKICDILLDQTIVAGIGNYLMAEILYYSGIHPKRIGNTITDEELEQIRISSHKVVKLSYDYGGFTLKSYLSPSKNPGLYPPAVYGKKIDSYGYKVIREKLTNGRSIHYVAEFQKL